MNHYQVVIIGCGPVGAVSANILGQHGISTLIIERDISEHGQQRAFSCDDEGMRVYQYIGLDEKLRAEMFADSHVDYSGLNGRIFAEIVLEEVDFGHGFRPIYFFHQPALEKTLREGFRRFSSVNFKAGYELLNLQQEKDNVCLEIRNADGQIESITADYVLGADGGRSSVRKLLGIELEGIHYEEPWLAVSGIVEAGAAKLNHIRFVCDPERPVFVGPAPFNQYRIEFKLKEGETVAEMEKPEKVRELLSPYLDPKRFEIQRAAVYTFHNAVAKQWRKGRVFLLGDAAHMMPPFMGQGLVSGLRDSINIGWKLAYVLRGGDAAILDSYEQERRPHVSEMADLSVKMGYVFLTKNKLAAALRDNLFRTIQMIPAVKQFFRHMKFKPKPIYPKGFMLADNPQAGKFFPQMDVCFNGKLERLDDVLGKGFAVISRKPIQANALWERLEAKVFVLDKDIQDESGKLKAWFDKAEADLVIIRPDRFIFAAGASADLPSFEAELGRYFATNRN